MKTAKTAFSTALAALSSFALLEGLSGSIEFDENGDVTDMFYAVYEYTGGRAEDGSSERTTTAYGFDDEGKPVEVNLN